MKVTTALFIVTLAGATLASGAMSALAQERPAPEPQQAAPPPPPPAPAREQAAPREQAVPRSTPIREERGGERGWRDVMPPPAARQAEPAPSPPTSGSANDDRASRRWPMWSDRGERGENGRATPRPTRDGNDPDNGRTVVGPPAGAGVSSDDQRPRAVPRGESRPRGDRPATGTAVPRRGPPPRSGYPGGVYRDGRGRGGVYIAPRYYSYYYYPRRAYPYGYGGFGLGFYYYDPYTWYGYDPYAYGRPYSRGYDSRYWDEGELRLDVRPRSAEVYVDGYYAGIVDDFDGLFQSLRLEEGPHRIEIVAPGFEPIDVDVRIEAGRKTTYRGDLRPYRP